MNNRFCELLFVGVFVLFSAGSASGQLLGTKSTLTLDAVKTIITGAESEAVANNWNVIIAIVDDGGHLLYLERMDGVQIPSLKIAQAKARTAALYRRPTKAFAERLNGGSMSTLNLPDVMTLEGGLPIVVDGVTIGGIGVSGVRAAQDAQIAQAGLDALAAALAAE